MSDQKIGKIVIVDDHPVMRMGLSHLIQSSGDLEVCGEAGTAAEAITLIESIDHVDLVIVDLSLPDQSGLELIKAIKAVNDDIRCLIISSHDEEIYAERVLRAGGRGYIMKDRAPGVLIDAIKQVLDGGIFVSPEMTAKLMEVFAKGGSSSGGCSIAVLTDRELEIYRIIGEGKTSREIAGILGISIRTVDAHRTHIKDKLGLRDAAELNYQAICWIESQT